MLHDEMGHPCMGELAKPISSCIMDISASNHSPRSQPRVRRRFGVRVWLLSAVVFGNGIDHTVSVPARLGIIS